MTRDVPGRGRGTATRRRSPRKPEAIMMATGGSHGQRPIARSARLAEKFSRREGRKNLFSINGDFLSRPGPRLVDGLEQMARALHPEAFKR